ncbi:hypothetical protein RCL1_004964 [Eukaryota sp. TZLM3-RCL]
MCNNYQHKHLMVNCGRSYFLVCHILTNPRRICHGQVHVQYLHYDRPYYLDLKSKNQKVSRFLLACCLIMFLNLKTITSYSLDQLLVFDLCSKSLMDGRTLLHLAAEHRRLDVVKAILDLGIPYTQLNSKEKRHILHYAAECGAVDIIEFILDLMKNHSKLINPKAFKSFINQPDSKDMTPLFLAAHTLMWKHAEIPRELLKNVFKLLIDNGADFSVKNCEQMTILHTLVYNDAVPERIFDSLEFIRSLCPLFVEKLINVQDKDGETPFHTLIKSPRKWLKPTFGFGQDPMKNEQNANLFFDLVKLFRRSGGKISTIYNCKKDTETGVVTERMTVKHLVNMDTNFRKSFDEAIREVDSTPGFRPPDSAETPQSDTSLPSLNGNGNSPCFPKAQLPPLLTSQHSVRIPSNTERRSPPSSNHTEPARGNKSPFASLGPPPTKKAR